MSLFGNGNGDGGEKKNGKKEEKTNELTLIENMIKSEVNERAAMSLLNNPTGRLNMSDKFAVRTFVRDSTKAKEHIKDEEKKKKSLAILDRLFEKYRSDAQFIAETTDTLRLVETMNPKKQQKQKLSRILRKIDRETSKTQNQDNVFCDVLQSLHDLEQDFNADSADFSCIGEDENGESYSSEILWTTSEIENLRKIVCRCNPQLSSQKQRAHLTNSIVSCSGSTLVSTDKDVMDRADGNTLPLPDPPNHKLE